MIIHDGASLILTVQRVSHSEMGPSQHQTRYCDVVILGHDAYI